MSNIDPEQIRYDYRLNETHLEDVRHDINLIAAIRQDLQSIVNVLMTFYEGASAAQLLADQRVIDGMLDEQVRISMRTQDEALQQQARMNATDAQGARSAFA